ncbi:MAG: restriction endonuclease subunit S [Deltaproteobacteria bacterium]|jgi:type I restriction enzyme S subunit|nr:restriction endonuclease subunit S [Deltaproteobacteria bacterium]MDL1986893.1 restriction endonuclease subunit S [Deltaproteobacteria bacterium]
MTKSSLNKLPLKSLFRLDTTSCLPASQPEQAFLHHSIPAWDESGGPVVELGNTIGSNKFLISHACVLVSKLNPRKSRVSVVRDLHGEFPQCASTEFMVYVPIHEDADIGFYSWYMKSECFQSELEKVATGTTNSHVRVTPKETLNWKIAHPPLPEQRRIAEILDTTDEAIQKTEALISKLKAMKQGLLHDLLTRGLDKNGKLRDPKAHPEKFKDSSLGRIPKGWVIQELGNATPKIQDGTHFSPKTTSGPFRYLTSKNIRFGHVDLSGCGWISEKEHEAIYSRCDVRYGDVLLTKDGANTGNAAINNLKEPVSLLSSVAFIRCDDRTLHSEYVFHYLLSPECQQRIKDLMSGNAITRLTLERIKSFVIPVLDIKEQLKIIEPLNSHDAHIRAEGQYRDKLKLQKKGLMHDLLTGKVRVRV